MRNVTAPTSEFVDLCEALYGDLADAGVLWSEVSKMSPGPSDVHVPGAGRLRPTGKRKQQFGKRKQLTPEERRANTQRKVAVGSNLLGLTAGGAAIGSTLRDDRLKTGGRVSQRLARTGERIPAPISRLTRKIGPRGAGKLAIGAAALQGANVAGDVVVSQTLPKEKTSKRADDLEDVSKVSLVSLKNGKLNVFRRMARTDPILEGGRKAAERSTQRAAGKKETADRMASDAARRTTKPKPGMAGSATVTPAVAPARGRLGRRSKAAPTGAPAAAPSSATPLADAATSPGTGQVKALQQQGSAADGVKARDGLNSMLGTTSGKVAIGGAAGGTYFAGRKNGKKVAYGSMDPYAGMAKRDSTPAVEWAGTFSKFDEDKRLAFGWASVVKVNGEPVVDRQGDFIGIGDIEDAAYVYVEKSRVGGDMHRRVQPGLTSRGMSKDDAPHKVAELVESMVFTPEKIAKMGLPEDFPIGWWVGFKVHDDEAWGEVKAGRRTGFSIHGKGIRKDVAYDSILEG